MALTDQDKQELYEYIISRGQGIASLPVGDNDLSNKYLAPVTEYTAGGQAARLVQTPVSALKGEAGKTPNLTLKVNPLPAGSEPTVVKTGTLEQPTVTIGVPSGKDGGVLFATFEIDPLTGRLTMFTDPDYTGANFELDEKGKLQVII